MNKKIESTGKNADERKTIKVILEKIKPGDGRCNLKMYETMPPPTTGIVKFGLRIRGSFTNSFRLQPFSPFNPLSFYIYQNFRHAISNTYGSCSRFVYPFCCRLQKPYC